MVQDRLSVGKTGVELKFFNQFLIERHVRRAVLAPHQIEDMKTAAAERKERAKEKIKDHASALRHLWQPQARNPLSTTSRMDTSTSSESPGMSSTRIPIHSDVAGIPHNFNLNS
jgi:hypothetical protein